MELRSRTRLQLRRAAMTAALGALLVPATAGAATKHTPTITKVTPNSVSVGDTMTIMGKYFNRGKGKNTVLFRRDNGKQLFVKADVSTTRKLVVVIPKALEKYMSIANGAPVATKFRLRVLSTRLGKAFTSLKLSPTVGPEKPKTGPGGGATPTSADGDCDGDGVKNGVDTDDDNDGLPDTYEALFGTDPCKLDSDNDGVSDYYEYQSAVDLNNDDYRNPTAALPYPGKRPYPNPLDGSDANTDFDGDGLTLLDEYKLWRFTLAHGATFAFGTPLTYSDGLKYSIYQRDAQGRRIPALPAANYDKHVAFMASVAAAGYSSITLPDDPTHTYALLDFDRNGTVSASEDQYYDINGDGWLSDDERDEDGDGLPNWVESHGPMMQGWWDARYQREKAFHIAYAGTDIADADSDGDGLPDGVDDQDHDDYPNVVELSRLRISAAYGHGIDPPSLSTALANPNPSFGRVNPFNPCLPYIHSRTCPSYIPFADAWAPFDQDDPDYLVLN